MNTGIDWGSMFVPTVSIVEVIFRGTLMYLAMFALLRIFRRGSGSVSVADLLVIVVIADAAQNGMAGTTHSITEALVLIFTIFGWNYFIDWIGFKYEWLGNTLEPRSLLLVRNGRMRWKAMSNAMITKTQLMSKLRQQGIEDIADVKECRLEGDGGFSTIRLDGAPIKGNRTAPDAVNL